MNHDEFDDSFSSSRRTEPDNKSHFHGSRQLRELRASILSALEARKGLILLTGGEGAGKTMFLNSFIREAKSNVTFIVESDGDANFADLLKLLLRNLDHESAVADRLSMLQSCKRLLRSCMDRGDIICLVLDNAERLSDDTLECVIQNFLGPAASGDHEQKLLQLILAGRPKLRERLARPPLRDITPPPGLVCSIDPLLEQEAGDYARHRLEAGPLPPRPLEAGVIERILRYAAGDLRVINSLCGHALAQPENSPLAPITVRLIDDAAADLGIVKAPRPESQTRKQNFEIPRERDEPFRFHLEKEDSTEVVGRTFLDYHANEPRPWLRPRERDRTAVRIVLLLIFLGAGFLWLQDQFGGLSLTEWRQKLAAINNPSEKVSTEPRADAPTPPQARVDTPVPPVPETLPPQSTDQTVVNPSPGEGDKPVDSGPVGLPEKGPEPAAANKPKPAPKATANNERRRSGIERRALSDSELESEVYRAIENRAISGIEVSVNNGTVYLQGRVATERQKRAAESAARSVNGIEQVRSRIVVS